jgi:Fe-Mn family superoxide dismutase
MENAVSGFNKYELGPLPYKFDALEPHISKDVLEPHYSINHKGYVDNANKFLDRYQKAINGEVTSYDVQGILRALTFNINGHKLHTDFWKNMAPTGTGGGTPGGKTADLINKQYGSFERFKQMFNEASNSLPGAGWAVLYYDTETKNLQIITVENHFMNHIANTPIMLLLDEWEHAYYLQYRTKRADYINAWWNVVNWDDAEKTLSKQV